MNRLRGAHLPQVPGMSGEACERAAERIVAAFRPDLIDQIGAFPVPAWFEFHLRQQYRLNTGVAELPLGVEGVTYPNGILRLAAAVYEALHEGDGRARMTAVHEGVHGILHKAHMQRLSCELRSGKEPILYRTAELPPYANPEWQAKRTSAAILLRRRAVRTFVNKYGVDVERLMVEFLVSRQAAIVRLNQLQSARWLSPSLAIPSE